jgi:RNA polymerase sigma factor (sigma-70 family)
MSSGSDVPRDLDDPRRQALLLRAARRAAMRETHDEQLAQEAAGHAVTELWRLAPDQRPAIEQWPAWVRTAATRYARRADQRRHREHLAGAQGSAMPAELGHDALDRLLGKLGPDAGVSTQVAAHVDLRRCLHQLPELELALLVGKYVDDLPSKVLAERHGMKPTAVDRRLSAVKKQVRQCLDASSG